MNEEIDEFAVLDDESTAGSHSPLWMVTTEPILDRFVVELQRLRMAIQADPLRQQELQFSQARLAAVRASFAHMIRQGEASLHQLTHLLCSSFLASYHLQSVVIGEVESTGERLTIMQQLSNQELYATADIDLGKRQLDKLRFFDGQGWSSATLVANVVDYQPTEPNPYAIHRVTSRIKAEEEIWHKVVDEIFGLDHLVQRDKQLRHLSWYVKDIFGVKIVTGTVADVPRIYSALQSLVLPDAELVRLGLETTSSTRRLELVETKDYLGHGHRKRSGWEALKMVVRWGEKTFEIQIQPLANFLSERELLTQESHVSFKAYREQVRQRIAEQDPLFRYYQELLRWLFLNPFGPPPQYPSITIRLVD